MLCWLCYRVDGRTEIVIQPGNGIIYARLTAGIAGLDEGEYIEGRCLDEAMSARVPQNMIGKRLSARQAKLFLDRLGEPGRQKRDKNFVSC